MVGGIAAGDMCHGDAMPVHAVSWALSMLQKYLKLPELWRADGPVSRSTRNTVGDPDVPSVSVTNGLSRQGASFPAACAAFRTARASGSLFACWPDFRWERHPASVCASTVRCSTSSGLSMLTRRTTGSRAPSSRTAFIPCATPFNPACTRFFSETSQPLSGAFIARVKGARGSWSVGSGEFVLTKQNFLYSFRCRMAFAVLSLALPTASSTAASISSSASPRARSSPHLRATYGCMRRGICAMMCGLSCSGRVMQCVSRTASAFSTSSGVAQAPNRNTMAM
mmetsp:Transcript_49693/g.124936  ORF Transcript_49693/g.124936 Transcript_49693/m.124936 type:complete len:282 (-) Transcript_49693:279-1124(-)